MQVKLQPSTYNNGSTYIKNEEITNQQQYGKYFNTESNNISNHPQPDNRVIEENSKNQDASTTNLTRDQRVIVVTKLMEEINKNAEENTRMKPVGSIIKSNNNNSHNPHISHANSSKRKTPSSSTENHNSTESKRRKLCVTEKDPVGVNSTNRIITKNQDLKRVRENTGVSPDSSMMNPDLKRLVSMIKEIENAEKSNTMLISKHDTYLEEAEHEDLSENESELDQTIIIDEPHDMYKSCLIEEDDGSLVEAEHEDLSENESELDQAIKVADSTDAPIILGYKDLKGVTENSGVLLYDSIINSPLRTNAVLISTHDVSLGDTIYENLLTDTSELDKTLIIGIDEQYNTEDNGKYSLFSKEDMDTILKDCKHEIGSRYLTTVRLPIDTLYLTGKISLDAINKIVISFTSRYERDIVDLRSQFWLLNKKLRELSLIHNNQTHSLCYKKYAEILTNLNSSCERMENHDMPDIISSCVQQITHAIKSFSSPGTFSKVTRDKEQSVPHFLLNDSNGHNVINENDQVETHSSSISKVTIEEEPYESELYTKPNWF